MWYLYVIVTNYLIEMSDDDYEGITSTVYNTVIEIISAQFI